MSWNKRKKNIGIYKIEIDGWIYIGKSVDIMMRWNKHLVDLFAENHHNKFLQEKFNNSNYRNINFSILKLCSKKDLTKLEKQYIIEEKQQDKLLNILLKKSKKVSNKKE
jgi:predicted GIY-YIG superfamily endonuclease